MDFEGQGMKLNAKAGNRAGGNVKSFYDLLSCACQSTQPDHLFFSSADWMFCQRAFYFAIEIFGSERGE